MLATLLVLSVLHASPADAPRLSAPRALSLLAPMAARAPSYGQLSHEHEPGVPASGASFSFPRALGGFLAGFGTQLVVGSGLWVTEVVAIFGATFVTAAFTNGQGTQLVLGAGTYAMIYINGALLPLLSALPVWLIAQGLSGYSHSFLWTWLSGLATYGVYWSAQLAMAGRSELGAFNLILWPTHLGGWFLTTLVQAVIVQLTREESAFASHAPTPALLNVEGRRLRWGTPLPGLVPDAARPGRLMPMLALAQGRF